jgi:hypothetical protein
MYHHFSEMVLQQESVKMRSQNLSITGLLFKQKQAGCLFHKYQIKIILQNTSLSSRAQERN